MIAPSFPAAFRFWAWLGCVNFGGPAGQIAIMHRELVEKRQWIDEESFLAALNFCMLLPGPEAQQLATYIGGRLHGTKGAVVAGSFFVIPSIFVMLFLSWLAVRAREIAWIAGLFYGIQTVVLALVVEALIRISKRALKRRVMYLVAGGAFVGLTLLRLPFPLIVLASAAGGVLLRDPAAVRTAAPHVALRPHRGRLARLALVFLLLWTIPVGSIIAARGTRDVLAQEALFFTKASLVTFGGAYAVLSYISDVAVNTYHWLDAAQMAQGLGLAETTPGPLIMVTQYVGFLGAWNHAGGRDPLTNAVAGALITTWVTFLPSFFFILAGGPFIDALSSNPRLRAALEGITAGVVGAILNLSIYFGTHVLLPGGAPDLFAVAAGVAAFILLQRWRLPVFVLVPLGAIAGMVWRML